MESKFSYESFFSQLSEECNFLLRNLKNPEVPKPENVESITLEFILNSLKNLANYVYKEISTDKASRIKVREEIDRFLKIYKELSLRRLDVHTKISEIAQGWVCPNCKNAVPMHVGVEGVRRPPLKVVIICRACNEISPITKQGYEAFDRYFGEIRNEHNWNPRANKFIYDNLTDSYNLL